MCLKASPWWGLKHPSLLVKQCLGRKDWPCPLGLSSCLIVSQHVPTLAAIFTYDLGMIEIHWNPTYSNDNDLGMAYYWIYNIAWYHVMSTAVIGNDGMLKNIFIWHHLEWAEIWRQWDDVPCHGYPSHTRCNPNGTNVARRWTSQGNVSITSAQWHIILKGKLENPRHSQKKHHPPRAPSSHPGFPLHWASHAAADPIAVGVPPHPPRWTSSMRTPWKSIKISGGSQRIAEAGWKVIWLRVRVRDLLHILGILIAKLKLDWGWLGMTGAIWGCLPHCHMEAWTGATAVRPTRYSPHLNFKLPHPHH